MLWYDTNLYSLARQFGVSSTDSCARERGASQCPAGRTAIRRGFGIQASFNHFAECRCEPEKNLPPDLGPGPHWQSSCASSSRASTACPRPDQGLVFTSPKPREPAFQPRGQIEPRRPAGPGYIPGSPSRPASGRGGGEGEGGRGGGAQTHPRRPARGIHPPQAAAPIAVACLTARPGVGLVNPDKRAKACPGLNLAHGPVAAARVVAHPAVEPDQLRVVLVRANPPNQLSQNVLAGRSMASTI